jgi:hypothetical protein
LLVALTFYTLTLNTEAFSHKVMSSLLNINTVGLLLQYLDFGLISQWTFSARGPTSSLGGQRNANPSLADRKALEQGSQTLWTRLQ